MNNDEFYKFEDRAYIQPTLSSGEQEAFIDNLRDIQSQANQQIQEDTYNLGSELPSNLGGLGAGDAYFTSRYQTPQVGEMTATLKSAAQAEALQNVMSNYQNQLQNRYKQAYRKYQKRQAARQRALLANANPGTKDPAKGKVKEEPLTKDKVDLGGQLSLGVKPGTGRRTLQAMDPSGRIIRETDDDGNIISTNEPGYFKGSDGYYHSKNDYWVSMPSNPVSGLYVGLRNILGR